MEYNEKNVTNKQNETICFSTATEYPRSAMTFGPLLNDRPKLDFGPYILSEA
ncbi:9188_t:CDS:1, partial [Funneliformis geosporum]